MAGQTQLVESPVNLTEVLSRANAMQQGMMTEMQLALNTRQTWEGKASGLHEAMRLSLEAALKAAAHHQQEASQRLRRESAP